MIFMLTNLSRPEELRIKDDIHEIAKSLGTIASSIPDTATEKTKKPDDGFFEHLYISVDHLYAVDASYNDNGKMVCVGLMEECSELIQALSKHIRYGNGIDLKHVIEEMAHVIICIRLVCSIYEIDPSDIQKEIMRKYPEGYAERTKRSE